MTGDFSNYLTANPAVNPQGKVIQINDPATGPHSGNIIPSGQVSPVAVDMTKFLPIAQALPNGRITLQRADDENTNEFVGRIDRWFVARTSSSSGSTSTTISWHRPMTGRAS